MNNATIRTQPMSTDTPLDTLQCLLELNRAQLEEVVLELNVTGASLTDCFVTIASAVEQVAVHDTTGVQAQLNEQITASFRLLQSSDRVSQRLTHVMDGIRQLQRELDSIAGGQLDLQRLLGELAGSYTMVSERSLLARHFPDWQVPPEVPSNEADLDLF